jgi:hypothetical protein
MPPTTSPPAGLDGRAALARPVEGRPVPPTERSRHSRSQLPQVLRMSCSQPLARLLSQSRKGAVQRARPQAPAVHCRRPVGRRCTRCRSVPQFATRHCAGQPRSRCWGCRRSRRSWARRRSRRRPVQLTVALARMGHAAPQRPQWLRSVRGCARSRRRGSALQSAKPAEQVCTQRPALHARRGVVVGAARGAAGAAVVGVELRVGAGARRTTSAPGRRSPRSAAGAHLARAAGGAAGAAVGAVGLQVTARARCSW